MQVTPARRRRRNNREAFVCIFAPAPSEDAQPGQRPQVAVAVYARPQGAEVAASDDAAAAASAGASAGGQDGTPGSLSLQNPLSGE